MPKAVFLGSTSSDLTDVRAELRRLIPSLGFRLICFEEPSFLRTPGRHAHDVCLDNVPPCDIYLLIIDERFGEIYAGEDATLNGRSVTWAEVEIAIRHHKTICTFVRNEVWLEKATYTKNHTAGIRIEPYYARDCRVFDFIEFIATQSRDNWIDRFTDVVHLKTLVDSRLRQIGA